MNKEVLQEMLVDETKSYTDPIYKLALRVAERAFEAGKEEQRRDSLVDTIKRDLNVEDYRQGVAGERNRIRKAVEANAFFDSVDRQCIWLSTALAAIDNPEAEKGTR